ncbi:MAG: metalloregulator ArsR/SmtB family transcription factor [bacterium]
MLPPAAPHPPLDEPAANETLARLAKALAHPARVAIIRLLIRRQSCICGEIVDQPPLAQSTVSQHLKQLKDAGLIRGEIDGPRVCYCVEPAAIAQLKALIEAL